MRPAVRVITVANALVYFGAALYHSGLLVRESVLDAATIPEALLGLVLAAAAVGIIRATKVAYLVVLAGTLFGLTIVVLRGALGVDLWIHIAMLVGLGVGLWLLFANDRTRSA